jgi:hypothetical protein
MNHWQTLVHNCAEAGANKGGMNESHPGGIRAFRRGRRSPGGAGRNELPEMKKQPSVEAVLDNISTR